MGADETGSGEGGLKSTQGISEHTVTLGLVAGTGPPGEHVLRRVVRDRHTRAPGRRPGLITHHRPLIAVEPDATRCELVKGG